MFVQETPSSSCSPTFSYPVLKKIISYLTIENRLQIAINCPQLASAERKADLKLEALNIIYELKINDNMQFRTHNFAEVRKTECSMRITDYTRGAETITPVTNRDQFYRKILNLYLADRGFVKIKNLRLAEALEMIERLPKDLKIKCKQVELCSDDVETFRAIRPFLLNLPKYLFVNVSEPEDPVLQDEMVQGANSLFIGKKTPISIIKDLVKLKNPYINIDVSSSEFNKSDVITLAKSWLNRCPEVGTQFCWLIDDMNVITRAMKLLKTKMRAKSNANHLSLNMRSGHKIMFYKASCKYLIMEVAEKNAGPL